MSNLRQDLDHANALYARGEPAGARHVLKRIAKDHFGNSAALQQLAAIAGRSRDFKYAIELLERVLLLQPTNATAHCNLGFALQELGEYVPALHSCDRAIALDANYALAFYNRGNALRQLGRPEAALRSYEQAIAVQNQFAPAYYNRGVVLQSLRRWDDALASYRQASRLDPSYTDAHFNSGVVLQELGRTADALIEYDAAIGLDPTHVGASINRGVVLSRLNKSAAALASLDRALALKPDSANAHFNRGLVQSNLKLYENSITSFDRALALGYEGLGALGLRRHSKMQLCDWQDYESERTSLIERIEQGQPASPPFHVLMMSDDVHLQRQAALAWASFEFKTRPPVSGNDFGRHDRIRVGYFSADFHEHATMHLMAQLFAEHDPQCFDITAFSYGPDSDGALRSRLKSSVHAFRDVRGLSDIEVTRLSRQMEIDIAVDLKGFTQFSRLEIFAHRAAPLQVSFLGYPGTLGVDFMDYLVSDRTVIPPGAESAYCEKIVFMPESYQVNDANRVEALREFEREQLKLPPGAFVFCCFNNHFKLTPPVFDIWMQILHRVDNAVLWLYQENSTAATNLRREAAQRGIDQERLVFAPFMPLQGHLSRHLAADLFLDTFPCGAHTTASDALWAGLPLLTCAGDAFASRVAASLLRALGLPELVTSSLGEYRERAVALATHPTLLNAARQTLSTRRLTSSLFDGRRYARHLEWAFRRMYDRQHAGSPLAHIEVPAMSEPSSALL